MGHQVFRVEKRKAADLFGKLGRHLAGDVRPEEALSRPGLEAVVELVPDRRDVAAAVLQRVAQARGPGRPGIGLVEIVMGGPPPRESKGAWENDQYDRWASSCRDHVLACFREQGEEGIKGGFVAGMWVHRDERGDHCHALVCTAMEVSTKDGGFRWSASWDRARPYLAELELGCRGTAKQQLSSAHDRFFRAVSSVYGIGRGKPGSKAVHTETDRGKGLRDRLADTQARLAEVTADLAAAAAAGAAAAWDAEKRKQETSRERRKARSDKCRSWRAGAGEVRTWTETATATGPQRTLRGRAQPRPGNGSGRPAETPPSR